MLTVKSFNTELLHQQVSLITTLDPVKELNSQIVLLATWTNVLGRNCFFGV